MATTQSHKTSLHVQCKVDGCLKEATRTGKSLCEMHYYRKRRTGTLDLVPAERPAIEHTHGYVLVYAPGHPLGTTSCRQYEHRLVYYDAHGAGPFNCHWCGVDVSWHNMHVDHLNTVRNDNRASNLVASCPGCNKSRGVESMRATVRAKSRSITLNGRTLSVPQWADVIGISAVSLYARLASGWSEERALTTPRGKTGPKGRIAHDKPRTSRRVVGEAQQ